jgi:multidrug efflux pump subunit AcrA (membrane-fusion protein)
MARDDDLKSQLGGFVRAALAQLETVREVVEQKSKAAKIQLDVAMLKRQRREILAELGSVVARLAANGRLSEDEYPELGAPLARLEALDERIDAEAARARRVSGGFPEDEVAAADDEDDEEDLDTEEESG